MLRDGGYLLTAPFCVPAGLLTYRKGGLRVDAGKWPSAKKPNGSYCPLRLPAQSRILLVTQTFLGGQVTSVRRPTNVEGVHRQPKHASMPERPYLPIGAVALCAACGLLLIAVAYTAGRHGHASSSRAIDIYWAGQALILVPVSIRLMTRRGSTEAATIAACAILAVTQYIAKVLYSPLSFTFADELSHWRTAENILRTGKLFTTNYAMPISPRYPGLEEVATALVQISGLKLFPAGLIVAGVAHLLFVIVLYLMFRNVGGSDRLAGIAVLIYSANPDLAYFGSLFAYQTLALPFFGIVLLAAWRLTGGRSSGDRAGWTAIAVVCIAATVVTHHVTSYLLAATLVLVAVASLLAKDLRSAARSGFLALWTIILIAIWVGLVAPQTVSYLWPPLAGVGQSFRALFTGGLTGAPTIAANKAQIPFSDKVIAAGAVLLLSCLLPVGWWQVRRYFRHDSWILALTFGSAIWYLIVAIRLLAADGSELSGRAAVFVYIPAAFVAAIALRWFIDNSPRLRATTLLGASLTAVLLMSVDGMVNSWPPYWERLPGPHQVGGVERSIGPEEIAVGNWMLAVLGPGNGVATDFGNSPMVGSYGDQTPVLGVGFLYMSSAYTRSVAQQAQLQGIHYVLADLRLTRNLPVSGSYWFMDPNAGRYTHPLPLVDMSKFNNAPGVTRIFDSGDIIIYDLSGGN